MTTNAPPRPPYAALATAGYGAVLGSLFPIMAVMTTADISGGLSVAADSGALVNTAHNIGSIAGILAAPSFAMGIGRGRTMAVTGWGFTIASMACALAPNLPIMLVARFIHGIFGGVMPFMFMLMVMTSLRPGSGRFEGMALFATSTALFFGLAASVGGWLSDSFGWRALFWAQALACAPYAIAASFTLPLERGNPDALRSADWASYAQLTSGLAALVFAFSEGERHFWLETWWVPGLAGAGALLVLLGARSMSMAGRPLLLLSVFRRPAFTIAILLSLIFRFGSLFAIFIVPQYLGRLQGLRSTEVGQVLAIMVPTTAAGLAVAYACAYRWDSRLPLSLGLACFAAAAWICSDLGPDWALDQLRSAAAVAGLGLGLFSVTVLRFATVGAGLQDGPTVGVVFNLARVLGIVFGLAVLSHLVVEREKFHSAVIVERLAATDPGVAERLATSSAAYARLSADPVAAQAAGTATLGRAASTQAFTLAFADTFAMVAIVLVLGSLLVWAIPGLSAERRSTPEMKGSPA